MSIALLEFFASAAIIAASGIGMARTADTISRVTGLGQLLVLNHLKCNPRRYH
jgi:hypothetical protein